MSGTPTSHELVPIVMPMGNGKFEFDFVSINEPEKIEEARAWLRAKSPLSDEQIASILARDV